MFVPDNLSMIDYVLTLNTYQILFKTFSVVLKSETLTVRTVYMGAY